jgi:hypothetical protein
MRKYVQCVYKDALVLYNNTNTTCEIGSTVVPFNIWPGKYVR